MITIHSERLSISEYLLNPIQIANANWLNLGATPISDLAIVFMLMQTLIVNGPIDLHCTQNKLLSQSQMQLLTVNRPLPIIFMFILH